MFLLRLGITSKLLNAVWIVMRDLYRENRSADACVLGTFWHEANHFVSAVEEHVKSFVTISAWKKLQNRLNFACPPSVDVADFRQLPSLGSIRVAHRDYVASISRACFQTSKYGQEAANVESILGVVQKLYELVVVANALRSKDLAQLRHDFNVFRTQFFASLRASFHKRIVLDSLLARMSMNGFFGFANDMI